MKKVILFLIVLLLILSIPPFAKGDTILITLNIGKFNAFVNGREVLLDVSPIIDKDSNRTLVPLRFISEAFGAEVSWIANKREIDITFSGNEIKLWIDQRTAYINDSAVMMDCSPRILFDRTLVPLRFISEAFGAEVSWFPEGKRIEISLVITGEGPHVVDDVDLSAVTLSTKTVEIMNPDYSKINFSIVKINLAQENVKIVPYLAKGGPNTTESYSSFVKRLNPITALNGGTFDLDCHFLTGDVVRFGIPQYIRYDGYEYKEMTGTDKYNKPFFEDGNVKYFVKVNGKEFSLLSVNGFPKNPWNCHVKLYTNWYKGEIYSEIGQTLAVISSSTTVDIKYGVFYPSTLDDMQYALILDDKIEKGDKAEISILINGKDYSGSSFVRCGPLLIKEGKSYIDYSRYGDLERATKKGTRCVLGFDKSGNMYFVYTPNTVSLSDGTLSIALEKLHLFKYATSVDGGGSTLLYYKGKYIATAGREIMSVIVVGPGSGSSP